MPKLQMSEPQQTDNAIQAFDMFGNLLNYTKISIMFIKKEEHDITKYNIIDIYKHGTCPLS